MCVSVDEVVFQSLFTVLSSMPKWCRTLNFNFQLLKSYQLFQKVSYFVGKNEFLLKVLSLKLGNGLRWLNTCSIAAAYYRYTLQGIVIAEHQQCWYLATIIFQQDDAPLILDVKFSNYCNIMLKKCILQKIHFTLAFPKMATKLPWPNPGWFLVWKLLKRNFILEA